MNEPAEWLEDVLRSFGNDLATVAFPRGAMLYEQGDSSEHFTLVLSGRVEVRREDHVIAVVDGPAVIGELFLFTDRPRASGVVALTHVEARRGTRQQFRQMLTLPSFRRYLFALATNRVVEDMEAVPFETAAGFVGTLRPLLRSDEAEYRRGVRALSPTSRRRRFFSASLPPDEVLTALTELDWINHFAWVAIEDAPAGPHGVGVARFIRDVHDPTAASVAFGIADDYQGRGLGRVLFAALSVPAEMLGITTFTAEVLAENAAVRALLGAAEPVWKPDEPGVLAARMSVASLRSSVDEAFADLLRTAVSDIARIFEIEVASDPIPNSDSSSS